MDRDRFLFFFQHKHNDELERIHRIMVRNVADELDVKAVAASKLIYFDVVTAPMFLDRRSGGGTGNVKTPEDRSGDIVLRLYESLGSAVRCRLRTVLPLDSGRREIALDFRPFEVKTAPPAPTCFDRGGPCPSLRVIVSSKRKCASCNETTHSTFLCFSRR